jgi:hypothetical protein
MHIIEYISVLYGIQKPTASWEFCIRIFYGFFCATFGLVLLIVLLVILTNESRIKAFYDVRMTTDWFIIHTNNEGLCM